MKTYKVTVDEKSTIEFAISNLDTQIQYRCNEIELSNKS